MVSKCGSIHRCAIAKRYLKKVHTPEEFLKLESESVSIVWGPVMCT